MKVLILSTATGEGHNSAALAVAEALRAKGCETFQMDCLNLGRFGVSEAVSRLYADITVRAPGFFSLLYRAGMAVTSAKRLSPIYYLNALCAPAIHQTLLHIGPDAVVCTHIFSAQAVSAVRRKFGLNVPAVGVATDYTCIPFWEDSALDFYIIPDASLVDEFAARGIPPEKLLPLGIPVREQYRTRLPREQARREFRLQAKYVFVVMGGSMGYGDIPHLADELLRAVPDSQVAAVCGKNRKMIESLAGKKGIVPFGFLENAGELMDAADVVLTKPGGLTSTETLAKRIPTVLTRPIPGCEERNARYLSSAGAAVCAGSPQQAALEAARLLADGARAGAMREAQEKFIHPDAASKAGDFLISLIKEKSPGAGEAGFGQACG